MQTVVFSVTFRTPSLPWDESVVSENQPTSTLVHALHVGHVDGASTPASRQHSSNRISQLVFVFIAYYHSQLEISDTSKKKPDASYRNRTDVISTPIMLTIKPLDRRGAEASCANQSLQVNDLIPGSPLLLARPQYTHGLP